MDEENKVVQETVKEVLNKGEGNYESSYKL